MSEESELITKKSILEEHDPEKAYEKIRQEGLDLIKEKIKANSNHGELPGVSLPYKLEPKSEDPESPSKNQK